MKQIALTEKQIEGVLAAGKDMDAITEKLPENAKPDPKVTAQLDAVAKKNGFASYDEYNDVIDNISLVIAGFDPATKKYVGNEAVIKAQIAQVQADKKMSAQGQEGSAGRPQRGAEEPDAADPEQGQYRPRGKVLRQARRLDGRRSAVSRAPHRRRCDPPQHSRIRHSGTGASRQN